MEPTSIYATAAGGICLSLFLFRISSHLSSVAGYSLQRSGALLECFFNSTSLFLAEHLTYAVLLPRHSLFGQWTRSVAIMHFAYAGVNFSCAFLPAGSLLETAQRAGNLSLINLIVATGSGCFDLCADVLGVPRHVCPQVHRATAWMTTLLLTVHAIAGSLASSGYLRTKISGLTVIFILIPLIAYRCHAVWEGFRRLHQMLAFTQLYAIWRHLPSAAGKSLLYVVVAMLIPTLSLLYYSSLAVHRNGMIPPRGRTCMTLSYRGFVGEETAAANLHIALPRPIKVDPGQYVNLWMPSVSFWSWAEVHPYMIVSWEENPVDELDVIVEARSGFSARLVRHAQMASPRSVTFPGLVIGPHGISKDLNRYTSILAVTSDSSICSVISYVKRSICSHNTQGSRTRRIHLVWRVEQPGKLLALLADSADLEGIVPPIESLLTDLLELDAANSNIFHLSIYSDSVFCGPPIFHRAVTRLGKADYKSIIQDEVLRNCSYELSDDGNGNSRSERLLMREVDSRKHTINQNIYNKKTDGQNAEDLSEIGDLLVIVAATDEIRDQVQMIARRYLHQKVSMTCLVYQP